MRQPEVVVITGASAGVGRAVARRFAADGARIALLARGRARLDAACAEVEEQGGQGLVVPCDVAEADQVFAAADQVEQTLGPIDIWINNAMATVFSPLDAMEPEEYRRVTEVTYHGYVWGTQAALRHMKPRNRGSIVQVGSALAHRAIPLQSAYCGAKFAIRGFTDALRSELIHDGSRVHVTMVQLGAVNTPQFDWARSHLPRRARPVAPIYQPEVAAEAVHWAAHQRRRELWVGKAAVQTILGNRMAPWVLDRVLSRAAFDGQQTDEPAPAHRPDNLFEPPPGDPGAHGRFDDQALDHSLQLRAAMNRGLIVAAGLLLGAAAAGLAARRRERPPPRHREPRWATPELAMDGSGPISEESRQTTDHDTIRRWVEQRGGRPAAIKATGDGEDPGLLRVEFPGYGDEQNLEPLAWDDFFAKFEGANLAFLYQEQLGSGETSHFFKFVRR